MIDVDIKHKWRTYFYRLFNERDETLNYGLDDLTISKREHNFIFYPKFRVREVKEALMKLAKGKTIELDGILIEIWKRLGETGVL